jgi:hypothetical protein
MASPDATTADGYNREAQVNNISQLLLLKLAMPLLEAAADARGEARVVQQSSAARWGEPSIINAMFDKVRADDSWNCFPSHLVLCAGVCG